MGGALSNPVDADTKREIEEIIKAVLATFTKEYTKAFAIFMVKKAIIDAKQQPEEWHLLERPECKDNLKEGWLMKEGGVRKTWKKRYFVVRYDYTVDYYESEAEAKKEKGKLKGTMGLAGYRTITDVNDGMLKRTMALAEKMGMDTSQIPKPKEYPAFTFEVNHFRRRCYFARAENEEDFKQWADMFSTACRNAYGLRDKEWVHTKAFHTAVRKTRWSLGYWGWWTYGGNEEQILSDLIADHIDWVVMGRIYSKIVGPWQIRYQVRNQVLKTLDTVISAGVGPAWKAMKSVVDELRPKIEPKIQELVTPVAQAQEQILEKMKDAVMSIINPILQEHVTPHLAKIMEVIRSPMTDAYGETHRLFDERMNKFEPKGADRAELAKNFKSGGLDWYCRSWELWPAVDKVNVMYDPLWALNVIFPDIYPWSLIWHAHDELRKRMDNAIFTYEERTIKEVEETKCDPASIRDKIKAAVIEDYKWDSKKGTLKYFAHILKLIVMPPFNKLVIPASQAALDPLNSLIPDPVKEFVDLNDMFDELLNKIIDESCMTVVSS